jgi:diguanylate cyclase (GGDEF)-like protein/PAS domain S-box-containing protein
MPLHQKVVQDFISKLFNHLNGFVYQFVRYKDGRYAMPFASRQIENIFHCKPADVANDASRLIAMTHPSDLNKLLASFERSMESLEPWHCEWRIIKTDNTVAWLQGNSTPEKQKDGSIIWTGYIKDITEVHQLKEVANMSKVALHAKLNTMPDLLFEMNLAGVCQYVHSHTPETSLLSNDYELVGQHITAFLPSDACQNVLKIIKSAQNFNNIENIQFSIDLPSDKKWFEISLVKADHFKVNKLVVVLVRDITHQKVVEEKLQINDVAFRNITQGIVLTNVNGNIVTINQAFTDICGFEIAEIKGKKLTILQGEGSDNAVVNAINAAFTTFQPFEGEIINYKKNGLAFWNALTITPIFNENNNPQYSLVVIKDVTEKKNSEFEARVNATAFKSVAEAIMVTDANKIIISVNLAFERLTGFSQSEVVGIKARFYTGLNSKETINQIRQSFKNKVEFSGIVESIKKDKSTFLNKLTITPVFDENNQITNYVGVSNDITAENELKESLIQSRKFLLTVIDAVPSRIFWKDRESNYLGCNQTFAQDVGLQDPIDIYGKSDFEVWPKKYADKFRQDDKTVMSSGEDLLFYEEESVNEKGDKEWVLKSKVPLKNDQGEVVGLLGIYDVITEKKLAQLKLETTKRKLVETNEKYIDLYEFAPIGYMTINQGGMVVEANWKARALTNIKRKELGVVRFSQVVEERDKKLWQSKLNTLLTNKTAEDDEFELTISTKNKKIDLNLTAIFAESANNDPLVRITMFDVTEKNVVAHNLSKQEEYQRSLLDNFPYMVWLKDELGRFLTVNQAFLVAAGATKVEEVIGKTDLDFWNADLASGFMLHDKTVMEQRAPAINDEIIEVEGQHRWFETYKSPVIMNDQVVGTVGFARDISELKKTISYEKFKSKMLELVVSEPLLNNIYDGITHGVEQLNPEIFCTIALANEYGNGFDIVSAPSLPLYVKEALSKIRVGVGCGSIGAATFSKQRVIVEDVKTHPYWIRNKEWADKAGIAASWAEPIMGANGQIYGAFGLYLSRATSPNSEDISLIEQAAKLIGIAIERNRSINRIENLAYYDEVTNIPNRRYFTELVSRLLTTSIKKRTFHTLLYLDIDAFKMINETRGHDVGDLLLQEVADRIKKVTSSEDAIARIGNDEFAVLVSNIADEALDAAKNAEILASKLIKILRKPFSIQRVKHHLSASVGINVIGKVTTKTNADEVLKQADIAMNQAKQMGGDNFCFFDPKVQAKITAKMGLETELRKAIKQNQLKLFYQVQVDHTGRPFGAEALIRWPHAERGMISPAEFIPLAEDTELILPIGNWVLETACAQIKEWQNDPLTRELTLSVNISAVQFKQSNFVDIVKKCIVKYGIEPGALRLELTESMLLDNVEETVEHMNALGEVGVQFSLDDFGTGYSSLQYLKRLPLYQLKIDQSFVREIVTDSHDRTIVRTIIAMAQSMYIGVIAEGVETEEQKEMLLTNGCRRYQGYFFGRPMPIDQLQVYLKEHLGLLH